MHQLRTKFSRLFSTTSAALWLLAGSIAVAEAKPSGQYGPVVEKNYTLPYFIVGLAIVLGVVIVCRSSHRADRPDMPDREMEDRITKMSSKK